MDLAEAMVTRMPTPDLRVAYRDGFGEGAGTLTNWVEGGGGWYGEWELSTEFAILLAEMLGNKHGCAAYEWWGNNRIEHVAVGGGFGGWMIVRFRSHPNVVESTRRISMRINQPDLMAVLELAGHPMLVR